MLQFGMENDMRLRTVLKFEAARLSALASDLAEIARREKLDPSGTLFPNQAPLLEFWNVAVRPVACLTGHASGHPILDGLHREITTSDVALFSEELGWARTRSRWYRLGQRAPTTVSN